MSIERVLEGVGIFVTVVSIAGITYITIDYIKNAHKASRIVRDSEKEYFGRKLTKKERITEYDDKGFQKLVQSKLSEKKLGYYFNDAMDIPQPY